MMGGGGRKGAEWPKTENSEIAAPRLGWVRSFFTGVGGFCGRFGWEGKKCSLFSPFHVQRHIWVFPKIGAKSSILIGFSIINHPFWGTPIFGYTHI